MTFEARLADAYERYLAAAPTSVDATRIAATAMASRPARIGWVPRVGLLIRIAAAAALMLALIGGAILAGTGRLGPVQATPSPTAPGVATTPEALRATWLADLGPGPGGSPRILRLVVQGIRVSIDNAGDEQYTSSPVTAAADELAIVATDSTHGCQAGDIGRYRFALSAHGAIADSDGTLLGLSVVADDCAMRQAVLARGWTRAIDVASHGGRGAAVEFSPMIMVTLPAKAYTSQHGPDGLTLDSADGFAFIATRNPWGWSQPCTDLGGSKVQLAPNADAFVTYLASLPGLSVQRSAVEIDGRSAVHLTVPTTKTADCRRNGPNDGRLLEWTTADPANFGGWFISQGDTDSIYLVEVDGSLFLLQWLGPNLTTADELAVLSTVHFVDSLPGS